MSRIEGITTLRTYQLKVSQKLEDLPKPVSVTKFRRGAVISWDRPKGLPGEAKPWECGIVDMGEEGAVILTHRAGRKKIQWFGRWPGDPWEQASRSRRRVAFVLGNASCDWVAMATLTFPTDPRPEFAIRALKNTRRQWERSGLKTWAWFREFTARGRCHYHVFFGGLEAEALRLETRRQRRKGKDVDISLHPWAQELERTWLRQIGEPEDSPAGRFTLGNTVELLRSPDAAGRYAAKEASKRAQKSGGPEWAGSRWWGRSAAVHALPEGRADLVRWPEGRDRVGQVWDFAEIADLTDQRGVE